VVISQSATTAVAGAGGCLRLPEENTMLKLMVLLHRRLDLSLGGFRSYWLRAGAEAMASPSPLVPPVTSTFIGMRPHPAQPAGAEGRERRADPG
jgi:hypothetical protein